MILRVESKELFEGVGSILPTHGSKELNSDQDIPSALNMYNFSESPMYIFEEAVINVLSYLYSWRKLDKVKFLSARLSVRRLKLRYSQWF